MYENEISRIRFIVHFRRDAKKLVRAHAEDIEQKYPDESTRNQKYQDEILLHRLYFNSELTALLAETLQRADHLSDIFRKTLEEKLRASFVKYQDHYKARY